MVELMFDRDQLFKLIDEYNTIVRDGKREGYEGGNEKTANMLDFCKYQLEEWYPNEHGRGKKRAVFDKVGAVAENLNRGYEYVCGVPIEDTLIIASWLGFILGMLTAENNQFEFSEDFSPIKSVNADDWE